MMINLSKIKKIHFTGIKGVGMTALALCAKDLGIAISGSDTQELFPTDYTLKKAGICWRIGFDKKNINKSDLLIFTGAHGGEDNVEVKEAKKRKIPVLAHGEALGFFMKNKKGISVCGVGGKTTTCSMIANILTFAGLNPSYAIGAAEIKPLGFPGKYNKKGEYFIAEADEYFTSPQDKTPRFFYQKPKIIVLTNIEFDHPDVYQNIHHTLEIFKTFINRLPFDGKLIANIDNENIRKIIKDIKVEVETYGFDKKADWQIVRVRKVKEKQKFWVKNNKKNEIIVLKTGLPGDFNLKNAVAAFLAAKNCGVKEEKIKKGILYFKGVKRRFELIKKIGGIRLYDDYAHHPSEIKATLKAAREWFGKRKITAIFQPHTYSRTKSLFFDFVKSFEGADDVYLVPIYSSAREKENLGINSRDLVREMRKIKKNVFFAKNKDELAELIGRRLKEKEIIFTLGAGDIFSWHKEIIKIIKIIKKEKTQL